MFEHQFGHEKWHKVRVDMGMQKCKRERKGVFEHQVGHKKGTKLGSTWACKNLSGSSRVFLSMEKIYFLGLTRVIGGHSHRRLRLAC